MCKFPGKILMLSVAALLLSVGAATADSSSSDWNNSWGFPSPAEKSNLLSQAIAIDIVGDGGFNANYYSTQNCNADGACFNGGEAIAIGSQVNIDVNGNGNDVNGSATTDGNTAAQNNNGNGAIDQNNAGTGPFPYLNN